MIPPLSLSLALSTFLTVTTSVLADLPAPIQCYEISPPVRGPSGPLSSTIGSIPLDACSLQLMSHDFGWSYGKPFVSHYVPPTHCGEFDRVVVNLTVSSIGRQYDRLALMFLGDVEVWRTSTAEPSPDTPITWTHFVDMTPYLSLWRSPQKLIIDLENLVDNTYTGVFHTVLTATFIKTLESDKQTLGPANVVIPITACRSAKGQPSHWRFPGPDNPSVTIKDIPPSAKRAVIAISANGQQAEEFWWANQLESNTEAFPPQVLSAMSPFREVQLLIDGELAGAQWPHPVVFTGGYAPNMHRPVVGIGAFLLRESEVDVTAWLPLLADGKEHNLALAVVAIHDNGKGGAKLGNVQAGHWVLSAKLFIWLGNKTITPGGRPHVRVADPEIVYNSHLLRNATNHPEILLYNITVHRELAISTKTDSDNTAWAQKVAFSASGDLRAYAGYHATALSLKGEDCASGDVPHLARYSYPTSLISNETRFKSRQHSNGLHVYVELNQTRELQVYGHSALANDAEAFQPSGGMRYPGFRSMTSKNGTADFVLGGGQGGVVRRAAAVKQQFVLWGERSAHGHVAEELYSRTVRALRDRVEWDLEVVRHVPIVQSAVEGHHGEEAAKSFVLAEELDFAPARGLIAMSRRPVLSTHIEDADDWASRAPYAQSYL